MYRGASAASLFLLGLGIVPRCVFGIICLGGEGASWPDVSAVSLFRWVGGIVFRRPSGIHFSMRGRHRVSVSPRYPFSDRVRGLCHDVSAVFRFRLAYGIVTRCDSGIVFSVEGGGHRIAVPPRHPFSYWAWASCPDVFVVSFSSLEVGYLIPVPPRRPFSYLAGTRCPDVVWYSFLRMGGGIVSRRVHGIPFPMGWGDCVTIFPRYSFSD